MPNDNVLMISRALLQDLFDDVSDYACSREFRAKEKAWRDDLLARVRSLLTTYPGAPEMFNAHPGQSEPRAEVTAAAADKRDAERYRYLRSRPESVEPDRIDVVYWSALDESANEGEGLRGDALDAAIDAALAQRQGEGS
ncbi:hypothetical protein [Burkholderia vietnamiensis]|uniref:hypothetical protein n=1 Tax=Burkholderia vietnamiensis TaxID=60552 RepID=UPI00075BA050|nr:hypothetical protein [Burkholderia vietnamiensis]KVS07799.1 hypothetical protein WK32_09715 [Burkholderia vietnamiensis]